MTIFKLQLFLFTTFINCYIGRCFLFGASGPINYCKEDSATEVCQSDVKLYVDRLSSEESLILHEYNDFDFCTVLEPRLSAVLLSGLGEAKLSQYKISFMENVNCAPLCRRTYNLKRFDDDVLNLHNLLEGMLKKYRHHWIVDSIPVTLCHAIGESEQTCSTGFPMGCYVNADGRPDDACFLNTKYNKPDTFYLFNHVDILITYHTAEHELWGVHFKDKGGRIISVKVQPRSFSNPSADCSYDSSPMEIPNDLKADTITINYTYSVTFIKDNTVKWSSRWDNIVESLPFSKFQWSMLLLPFMIVLFLSAIVGVIFLNTICKKNAHYNQVVSTVDKAQNKDDDWKPAYADVFKPPQRKFLFSLLIGNGIQVFLTSLLILLFAWVGFLPFAGRGAVLKYAMVLYAFLGIIAGYLSSRIFKGFGGNPIDFEFNIMLTTAIGPVSICTLYLLVDLFFWMTKIYNNYLTSFLLAIISWYGILVLQTLVGAYFGFKRADPKPPVQTGETSKKKPLWKLYVRRIVGISLGCTFPFACIFLQLYFILNSICYFELYYSLHSLLLVFLMFVITCSEVAIVTCYFHLRTGDYNWWWHSFVTTGSSGCMVFIYCIFFYFNKTAISDAFSTFLYFGCSLLFAFLYTLMTGSIGFYSSYWFVKRIYRERQIITLPNWRKNAFAVHLGSNEKKIKSGILSISKKNKYHVLQNECE